MKLDSRIANRERVLMTPKRVLLPTMMALTVSILATTAAHALDCVVTNGGDTNSSGTLRYCIDTVAKDPMNSGVIIHVKFNMGGGSHIVYPTAPYVIDHDAAVGIDGSANSNFPIIDGTNLSSTTVFDVQSPNVQIVWMEIRNVSGSGDSPLVLVGRPDGSIQADSFYLKYSKIHDATAPAVGIFGPNSASYLVGNEIYNIDPIGAGVPAVSMLSVEGGALDFAEISTNNIHGNDCSGLIISPIDGSAPDPTNLFLGANEFSSNAGYGIVVRSDYLGFASNTMNCNRDGGGSISFAGPHGYVGNYNSTSGNSIDADDCEVGHSSAAGAPGLVVVADSNVLVASNNVVNAKGPALLVVGGDSSTSVTGNDVSDNDADGLVAYQSGATLESNTVSGNAGHGILVIGSSASVFDNSISDNSGAGVVCMPDFGSDASPATAGDDVLGTPTIGGSGTSQPNQIEDNGAGGVFILDELAANGSTIETDNTLSNPAAQLEAAQGWYGLAEVFDGSQHGLSSLTVSILGDGDTDLSLSGDSDTTGLAGPTGFSLSNATSWWLIPSWVVTGQGGGQTRQVMTPHEIDVTRSGTDFSASYTWDGNGANDTVTSFGQPKCIMTSGLCRYQIGEIPTTP